MQKNNLVRVTRRFWLETKGQDLIEFALLAGFVAVSAAASMQGLLAPVRRIFRRLRRRLNRAATV